MGLYIFTAVVLVIAYYLVIVKNGNFRFWKKASKRPDFVYEQLLKNDAWVLDDGKVEFDKKIYDGPFLLHVPSLNKTVKFYGQVGKYEKSQKDIEEKIRLLDMTGVKY